MAVAALAGLGLAIALIAYHGWQAIARSLLAVGWGIAAVTAYHLLPMALFSLGWAALLKGRSARGRWVFLWAGWIREHVGLLLPVAQIGGEVVGARMLVLRGLAPPLAAASVVVDLTLETATQVLFVVLGLAVFASFGADRGMLLWTALGSGVGAALIGGFVLAQGLGLFGWLEASLKAIGDRTAWASLGRLDGMDAEIRALYARRANVAAASAYHFACWLVGTGEVWLALYFMGHPVGFLDALFLESLGEAIRGAAFIVPGQLGVQEGGYMLLVQVIGLAPGAGLTLSLIKRARALLLGGPALIAWQWAEGRTLRRGRRG